MGADGVERNVYAAVFGEGEGYFGEVKLAYGDDVGRAKGLQSRRLAFVGGDGQDAGAFPLRQLDQMRAQAAACAGDEDGFALTNAGLLHGLDRDADGTGEKAGFRPGYFVGNLDEGVFPHGNHLGHAALHAVADGLRFGAEAFQSLKAPLAPSAGVG